MAWKRIATILLAAIMAWAISQEQDQTQQQQAQAQQQQAAVRVAHLAVGASSVQVTIDGETHFENLGAESLSDYILVPAGDHQVEIRAVQDAANGQQQDGQQEGQQDEMDVQRGEVPEEVRQAVQSALDVVQQEADATDPEQQDQQEQDQQEGESENQQDADQQQDGEGADATQAVDQAVQRIGEAVQTAEAESLPLLEAVQASVEEARVALENDERQVAQEALQQAMTLIEEGAQAGAEDDPQAGQDPQDGEGAIFSETVTFEAGNYYTVMATTQHSALEMGSQTSPQAQTEGDDAESQANDQAQNGDQDGATGDIQVRVIQDDLSVAPAGSALVRVIHASSDAPTMDFVLAVEDDEQQTQDGQQMQSSDAQDGEQADAEDGEQADAQADDPQTDQEQPEGEQEGDEDAQAGQEGQSGELTITIRPEQASDATINVTGPDGFEQDLTGGQTLTGLQPGSYVIGATLQSYQQSSAEVEVGSGGTATAELTMQRLASAGPAPIDGDTVVPDLAANTASDFVAVPAGTYTAQLQATDRDLTAVELQGLDLQAGGTYTVLAYGGVADDSFTVTVSVDGLVPQGRDDQDGQQQDGQDQGQDDQTDAQAEGTQAMEQQLSQSLDDAMSAVEGQDAEAARQSLQEAQGVIEGMFQQAGDAMQASLQTAQESIDGALEAVDNENFEEARAAISQLRDALGL